MTYILCRKMVLKPDFRTACLNGLNSVCSFRFFLSFSLSLAFISTLLLSLASLPLYLGRSGFQKLEILG
jgi:hypothetical protein